MDNITGDVTASAAREAPVLTVADLLDRRASLDSSAAALVTEDGTVIAYSQLAEEAGAIAGCLAAANLKGGSQRPRIGIVLPNGASMAVCLLGASIAGEATPFNPAFTAPEFERHFRDTHIDALIVDEAYSGAAETVAKRMDLPVLRLTRDRRLAAMTPAAQAPVPLPDDVALVLMTSGSTGNPKIVPLTHRNVCRSAADVARSVALGPSDVCLLMWEQFHIGGLVDLLLAPLISGGSIVTTAGFDAARFYRLLTSHRPTWYQAVPTTLGELVTHAEHNGLTPRPSSLRFVRSVAAALTPALMDRVEALFGVPVIRTLGMTEAGPLITSTALPPAPSKPGSVGQPSGPEVGVFGPAGDPLAQGATGEIAVRGENVFAGYENNPEANAAAFRNGWFLTGDTGYFDAEGDLFLTGRVKEMINRGGYKISPSEVEEAFSTHPAVAEAAVFALPHPTLGEDILAAVSLRGDADAAALRAHLHERLAPHKVPGRISILPALPRNPVGKIDRLVLARQAEEAEQSRSEFAPPRTPTERFLVGLWSRELHLSEVGINQDFAALGGDSLSVMRILIAMETGLGQPVPDNVIENFTTVAEITNLLEEAGLSVAHSGDDQAGDMDALAGQALDGTALGTQDAEDDGAGLGQAIEQAASKEKLDAALEAATAYATPGSILTLLDLSRDARVGAGAASKPPLPARMVLQLRLDRARAALEQEIGAVPGHAKWQRRKLSEAAWLYGDPAVPAGAKALIAGFTGNLMRLQLPTYRLLLALDPARFDLLLLRDPSKALFGAGLPGVGGDVAAVADHVDTLAREAGYARVIGFGTSGGGLAAIYSALRCGWSRVVTASPPGLSVHADLARALQDLAPGHDASGVPMTLAHGQTQRDADAARQLLNLFPAARHQVLPAYRTHNILNGAHKAGKLTEMLDDWFAA